LKDLRGCNAILTGASRGLGTLMADALAAEGINVALAARSKEGLDSVRSAIAHHDVKAVCVPTDVTDEEQLDRLVATASSELGPIDILVNNAGIEATHPFDEYPPEEIVRLIEVNLTAPMLLTRKVLPGMLRRERGHIVNISSLAGKGGFPFQAPYASTKAALIMFTHTLRQELVDTHIGCSVVCPGFVADEGMYADMQRKSGVKASRLLGVSKPEKVAEAVVKAIKTNASELIVNPAPMRPVLAMSQLFPDVAPRVAKTFGVISLARRVVAAQTQAEDPDVERP
jgi:short-subunit dehydrogenase